MIGVDVDQAATIDGLYGEGITVTSAMKGLAATVNAQLTAVKDGAFAGGKVENLGLVSAVPQICGNQGGIINFQLNHHQPNYKRAF